MIIDAEIIKLLDLVNSCESVRVNRILSNGDVYIKYVWI